MMKAHEKSLKTDHKNTIRSTNNLSYKDFTQHFITLVLPYKQIT